MLASLRVHPRPGVSSTDLEQERAQARELLSRISKALELPDYTPVSANGSGNPPAMSRTARSIAEDVDVHTEIAQLWQGENLERGGRALREAVRISEATGSVVDPRLLNNLGVVAHFDERHAEARSFYESALISASGLGTAAGEAMATSVLYNLARVYEDQGEESLAKEAYEKLLTRHPEYVDGAFLHFHCSCISGLHFPLRAAKIRQAQMLMDLRRNNDAHELLVQALTSQSSNLNLRAFYTFFLIQTNSSKPAKDFVFATLKDHDKYDVYSLCAAGWIMYHQARESRETMGVGLEERRRGFQRSAEFYEKALQLDPMCAIAAQGLAIVTAEDALGSLTGVVQPGVDENQRRLKSSREALDVFAKVRESVNDGSVYLNMGHCYYARDEFDRAIESVRLSFSLDWLLVLLFAQFWPWQYETASIRFYRAHNVPTLLCLCRSWYAKANKDQSFAAMNTALQYAQRVYFSSLIALSKPLKIRRVRLCIFNQGTKLSFTTSR
jgi:RNA polymerase-associated protein CTR9